MPVRIRKLKGGRVRVSTPGGIKAKSTTMQKAKAQEQLLNAIEHNPDFKPRKGGYTTKLRKAVGI